MTSQRYPSHEGNKSSNSDIYPWKTGLTIKKMNFMPRTVLSDPKLTSPVSFSNFRLSRVIAIQNPTSLFGLGRPINKAEKMDNQYLNKRRLGTTLLPWQQKFCDDQMYFTLDHPCAKFQSNLTYIRWEIDHLNFHKTGFLIIWRHKFCWTRKFFVPEITLIWPSLNLYNSGTRRDIEKWYILLGIKWSFKWDNKTTTQNFVS